MARIRTVKPEFWSDYRLAHQLTRDERLFYIGLWNEADDEGRFLAHPRRLLGAIFPYEPDLDEAWVVKSLDQLARTGRLVLYIVDGEPYGQLSKFGDHQKINKPTPSKIPAPVVLPDSSVTPTGMLTESVRQEGKGKEQGMEQEGSGNARARDALSEWLGEHGPILDGCRHLPNQQARDSFYNRYGPPGLDPNAWKKPDGSAVPTPDRPRLFALALSGYALEGGRFVDREFNGKLRGHIRDELSARDGPADTPAPLSKAQFKRVQEIRAALEEGGMDPEEAAEEAYRTVRSQ